MNLSNNKMYDNNVSVGSDSTDTNIDSTSSDPLRQNQPYRKPRQKNLPMDNAVTWLVDKRCGNDRGGSLYAADDVEFRHCCVIFPGKNLQCFKPTSLRTKPPRLQRAKVFRERDKRRDRSQGTIRLCSSREIYTR